MGGEALVAVYAEAARLAAEDRKAVAIIESQPEQPKAWMDLVEHPARRHRVRMAAAVEMALNAAVHGRQAILSG